MSLLGNQTSLNQNEFFFLKATGQQINISSVNTDFISAGTITANDVQTNHLETSTLTAETVSSAIGVLNAVSTTYLDLDGQVLTATPTDLLLNGVPLATTSNLSSIQDWALDPAISSINANGYDLLNANNVSSVNVRAQNGFFQNLMAMNTFFISSYVSTISSQNSIVDELFVSSISSGIADITTLFTTDLQNVSSINNQDIDNFSFSTVTANAWMSTPVLYVSSINGAEFTSTTLTIEVAGVSSLTANFVSSLGAELRQALVSTIQFNAGGFNPKLDLNFDVGSLVGGLKSGLTNIGIGVGAGVGLVGTGILASAFSRPGSTSINNNVYEQYAVPTQLQFSTLGEATSTFARLVSSSGLANTVPGEEIIISSIIPAGTLCLRSYGDPTNLIDPSTFTSSIQAFGQWEPVPIDISTIVSTFSDLYTSTFNTSTINGFPISQFLNEDPAFWANYPAVSTISFSTGTSAIIQSANTSTDNIALVGSNIQLIGGHTDAKNLLLVSSISTGIIYGANNDIFAGLPFSTPGLSLNAPIIFLSSPSNLIAGVTSVSTLNANSLTSRIGNISSMFVSSLSVAGPSTIIMSTATSAGSASQPAGRLMISGNDLDLGQQDLWCQQVRIGATNPGGSAQTEVIFYSPDNLTIRGLGLGGSDATIRIQSTINSGTNNGYLLDTTINKPFFSTINQSTAMMAIYPSTTLGSFGVSTLSFMPPKVVAGAFSSASTQNLIANTPLALWQEVTDLSVGGITTSTTAIVIPNPGIYEIYTSIQFTKTGGAGQCDFWIRKNGVDVPNTASEIYMPNAGNGQTLGNVALFESLNTNDKIEIIVASPDSGVSATFLQSTVTTPYTRPAVPSVITNVKCLNY